MRNQESRPTATNLSPEVRNAAIRLADYVDKVCDGLAAGTTTADQARRGLAAEHGIFWDRFNAGDEVGYLRAVNEAMSPPGNTMQLLPDGDTEARSRT